jgi:NADH-quinone oxidoreductase subunit E
MVSQDRHGSVFHYWISFWPVAPFFGVKWRFEAMAPLGAFFRPVEVMAGMTRAGADEAARATSEAVEAISAQVEAAAHAAADAVAHAAEARNPVEALAHVSPVAMAAAVAEALSPAPQTSEVEAAPEAAAEPILSPEKPALLFSERPADADDLKVLRGVGPKLEAMLNEMGVYTLRQVAGFTEGNLAWVDSNLTAFKGRPLRDGWVEQARALI